MEFLFLLSLPPFYSKTLSPGLRHGDVSSLCVYKQAPLRGFAGNVICITSVCAEVAGGARTAKINCKIKYSRVRNPSVKLERRRRRHVIVAELHFLPLAPTPHLLLWNKHKPPPPMLYLYSIYQKRAWQNYSFDFNGLFPHAFLCVYRITFILITSFEDTCQ